MELFAALSTDPRLEEGGVWVPYGDAELLIARDGNAKHQALRSKLAKRHQHVFKGGNEEAIAAAVKEITVTALSQTILLDWRNVTENGKPVAYTPEIGHRYMSLSRDFLELIEDLSKDMTKFKDKVDAENVKK